MARTITSTYMSGVTLSNAGDNPVGIAGGAVVGNTAGVGLYSNAAVYWSITNAGTIVGTGTTAGTSPGIGLAGGGGAVTNQSSGEIQGYVFGVVMAAAGTVVNQGTIRSTQSAGNGYSFTPPGTANAASIIADSGGVAILGGGVSNVASGVITGIFQGVALNAAGSVVNAGTISGTGTKGIGIILNGAGTVTNVAGASIYGGQWGIIAVGAPASVANAGTVAGGSRGVFLYSGGAVSNAANGTISGASYGVKITNAVGAVSNQGSIVSSPTGGIASVALLAGGSVYNAANAAISGSQYAVVVLNGAGSVTNLGSISNSLTMAGATVRMSGGGALTNGSTGTIAGKWIGVQVGSSGAAATAATTIVNQGSISAVDSVGDGADLWLRGPSVVLNTGTISGGPYGIVLYDAVTVVNLGVITGGTVGAEGAVVEGNTGNAAAGVSLRLEEAPGARLTGNVIAPALGAGDSANVLTLLSGASPGTISGFGSVYQNFGVVSMVAGATWSLGGTVAASQTIALAGTASRGALTLANPGSVSGVITGFGSLETIALAGITDVTGVSLSASGNVLSVYQSAGPTLTLNFDPTQSFTHAFTHSTVGTATDITLACFAAGTRIGTEGGAVAVEQLRVGQRVRTQRGTSEEIIWIGRRAVDCRRHPDPATVQPVRIRAGAFGPGLPARDLRLSPDHAVFVEGVLIPVRCLVDGVAILREDVDAVVYYHVELRAHDVILAEDLPVESYLDTGNRANFGGAVTRLFADFAAARWEAASCAPLVTSGPELDAVRRGLAVRQTDESFLFLFFKKESASFLKKGGSQGATAKAKKLLSFQ